MVDLTTQGIPEFVHLVFHEKRKGMMINENNRNDHEHFNREMLKLLTTVQTGARIASRQWIHTVSAETCSNTLHDRCSANNSRCLGIESAGIMQGKQDRNRKRMERILQDLEKLLWCRWVLALWILLYNWETPLGAWLEIMRGQGTLLTGDCRFLQKLLLFAVGWLY